MSTEYAWFEKLYQLTLKTQCKQEGVICSLDEGMKQFTQRVLDLKAKNQSVWWMGNGGSAAICSHLAQDFLNRLQIRSTFFNDASVMTCMANDYGYENVYARLIDTLGSPGDLLIAISSSGNSDNILKGVHVASHKGMQVVGLSGFEETNQLWALPLELSFYLPSQQYGLVETGHLSLLHALVDELCEKKRRYCKLLNLFIK